MKVSHLAATWFFVFGLFHLLWVFGWYIGLDTDKASEAFQRNWFWIYNVIATVLCFVGGLLSLHLQTVSKHRWVRTAVVYGGWIAFVLLVLRSLGFLAQVVGGIAVANFDFLTPLQLWDVWFCIGATLFAIAFQRYRLAAKSKDRRDQYSLR